MLSGIKYPQNLRAMHLLVEEVLRSVIEETDFSSVIMVINIIHDRIRQVNQLQPNGETLERYSDQTRNHYDGFLS